MHHIGEAPTYNILIILTVSTSYILFICYVRTTGAAWMWKCLVQVNFPLSRTHRQWGDGDQELVTRLEETRTSFSESTRCCLTKCQTMNWRRFEQFLVALALRAAHSSGTKTATWTRLQTLNRSYHATSGPLWDPGLTSFTNHLYCRWVEVIGGRRGG